MLVSVLAIMVLHAVPLDTIWTEKTDGYEIEVCYPAIALENQVLGGLLQAYAMEVVMQFERQFEENLLYDPMPTPWYLELNLNHEPSPDGMICILVWQWDYMGGAHGNTSTQALNYREEAMESVGVVELLGGEEELTLFSEKVIEELMTESRDEGWVQRGAGPDPQNYHSVTPVPDENGRTEGYIVIFPPYQVECYAYGPIEVYIPLTDLLPEPV